MTAMVEALRRGASRLAGATPRSLTLWLLTFLAGLTLAKVSVLAVDLAGSAREPPPAAASEGPALAPFGSAPLPEPAAGPSEGAEGAGDRDADDDGPAPLSVLEGLDAVEAQILSELRARRIELDERERALELRREVIESAEARLAEQRDRLLELKEALEARVEALDAEEQARIASLVDIYERMKPKAAAEIFDQLQMEVLLEVVDRMAEVRAAEVIARMNAAKARMLTAELAKRDPPIVLDR